MRDYEVVYIFKPDMMADDVTSRLERYHQLLTGTDGSEITAVEHWGKRQLAYPIQNEMNGYYVVAQFRCDAASLPEYERLLKLEEQLLRYLVVLSEGELPTPPSAGAEEAEASRATGPAAKTEPKAEKADEAKAEKADEAKAEKADEAASEPATSESGDASSETLEAAAEETV